MTNDIRTYDKKKKTFVHNLEIATGAKKLR